MPPMMVTIMLPIYGEGMFSSLNLVAVVCFTIVLYNWVVEYYETRVRSQKSKEPESKHWLIGAGLMLLACGVGAFLFVNALTSTIYFLVE